MARDIEPVIYDENRGHGGDPLQRWLRRRAFRSQGLTSAQGGATIMFKHVFTALKRWLGPRKIERLSPPGAVDAPLLARSVRAARQRTHHIGPGRRSVWSRAFARVGEYKPHQGEREKARRVKQACARENMRLISAEEVREEALAGGQFGAGA